MKKIKFIFIIFILQTGFVQAYTFPMAEFSATSSEIRDFATTSTTTLKFLKTYKIPKEGVRIKSTEANFSVFPDYLTFSPGKKIFLISRKWQTACMYDEYGRKFFLQVGSDVKDFCVQTSTGKKDLPTELGLYNIQTKFGKDYKSTFYTTTGEKPTKKEDGAPMPFAMHLGRIIGLSPENKFWFELSDGTAMHEKQTINKHGSVAFVSHGCIALEKGMSEKLQKVLSYGDLVLVFNENIPGSISDMISISK